MGNKKCYTNFNKFIATLLHKCDKNIQITAECKELLNHFIKEIAELYILGCTQLVKYSNKITINPDALQCLTNIWFNQETADKILHFSNDTWEHYSNNSIKGVRKSERADLSLPPSRFRELYKNSLLRNQQLGEPCYVYLTAMIEYIIKEILLVAIENIQISGKKTIHGHHLYSAIQECTHLHPAFNNTLIVGHGSVH